MQVRSLKGQVGGLKKVENFLKGLKIFILNFLTWWGGGKEENFVDKFFL